MSGEGMAFIALMEGNDTRVATQNNEKLSDLRDRSYQIMSDTGAKPLSWQEFRQAVPAEKPDYLGNIVKGALVLGAIVGAIGLIGGAILSGGQIAMALVGAGYAGLGGTMVGALLGAYRETTTTKQGELLDKYGDYLDQVERTVLQGRGVQPETIDYRQDHAQKLDESRVLQVSSQRGK